MRTPFKWPTSPPISSLLLFVSSSLLPTLVSSIEVAVTPGTELVDLNTLQHVDTVLPSFYKPETDEICFRNGVRYVSCNPDAGHLVKIDSITRVKLHELLMSKVGKKGTCQLLVDVMLLDLDWSPPSGAEKGWKSLKEAAAAMVGESKPRDAGAAKDFSIPQSSIDPSISGPAAVKKWGSPPVTRDEDRCYLDWLKQNAKETDVDTVLNELYVRHVAITQGDKKAWDVHSPTGCYEKPNADSAVHKVDAPGVDMLRQRSASSPENMEGDERPSFDDVDGDGIPDDMEVIHPMMGNHLKDPWAKYRKAEDGGVLEAGEFGQRKRSMGFKGWVGGHHRRHRRGNDDGTTPKPYSPTSPFNGDPAYSNGLPSAPVQQGAAGSGATESGGSAISSKPHGFAAGVTGGGSAKPVVPKDIKELVKLLTDAQPQVLHLDKVYDFRGSEGVCTNCAGCIPDSYPKCPDKGQLAIDDGQDWCKGKSAKTVTYDKAGIKPIEVTSNKSIIGISANAGIRGKGLRIAHHKNVILHNFRIDEINPSLIWGGDGVTLYDTDMIWIDKLTFALIGRQFIVTGYEPAGRVTISNCFFDCNTKWSATCDGSHYWTVLGYGKSDKVTFSGNMMKHCSGRSPRIANPNDKNGDSVWHVVNSVFDYNSGHSLDMGPGISALIEGNVFTDVAQKSLHESSPGRAFAPSDKAVCSQCTGSLGRECQPNAYKNASPVPSTTSAAEVLKDVAQEKMSGAIPPGEVVASVGKTAGCGGRKGGAGGEGAEQEGYGDGAAQTTPGDAATPGDGGAGGGESGVPQPAAGSGSGAGTGGAYIPGVGYPGGSSPTSNDPNQPALPGAVIGGPSSDAGSGNNADGASKDGYGAAANAGGAAANSNEFQKKQKKKEEKKKKDELKKKQQQQQQEFSQSQHQSPAQTWQPWQHQQPPPPGPPMWQPQPQWIP